MGEGRAPAARRHRSCTHTPPQSVTGGKINETRTRVRSRLLKTTAFEEEMTFAEPFEDSGVAMHTDRLPFFNDKLPTLQPLSKFKWHFPRTPTGKLFVPSFNETELGIQCQLIYLETTD